MLYLTEAERRFLTSSYRITKSAIEYKLERAGWVWCPQLSFWLDWCLVKMEALNNGSR